MSNANASAVQPQRMSARAPLRGYQDPHESWGAKFVRKFSENPLVPIGCLLTCGALVMSAYRLRQGKSKEMNHWLRARVALQGVTVVALLVGSVQLQKASREAEAVRAREEVGKAERAREKMEFERRLLEAERAAEEEARIGLRGGSGSASCREEEKKRTWWWRL